MQLDRREATRFRRGGVLRNQPTMLASVSTRTSSISIRRGLPANSGFGPPMSNGRLSAMVPTERIVMA
jgi:hypothetical protein